MRFQYSVVLSSFLPFRPTSFCFLRPSLHRRRHPEHSCDRFGGSICRGREICGISVFLCSLTIFAISTSFCFARPSLHHRRHPEHLYDRFGSSPCRGREACEISVFLCSLGISILLLKLSGSFVRYSRALLSTLRSIGTNVVSLSGSGNDFCQTCCSITINHISLSRMQPDTPSSDSRWDSMRN